MMEVIKKNVEVTTDVTVDVKPEDVLNEMTDDEIKSYYFNRFKQNLGKDLLSEKEIKDCLSTICFNRCPRNLEHDNDTIRKTINEIMDQVLY